MAGFANVEQSRCVSVFFWIEEVGTDNELVRGVSYTSMGGKGRTHHS